MNDIKMKDIISFLKSYGMKCSKAWSPGVHKNIFFTNVNDICIGVSRQYKNSRSVTWYIYDNIEFKHIYFPREETNGRDALIQIYQFIIRKRFKYE